MNKDKFFNPDYKPDENTCMEIENLHKEGKSLRIIPSIKAIRT